MLFHPGDMLSIDLIWDLFYLIGYCFVILLPFILGGIAIFVLRKKKKL